jgi:mannan endo-1,4-beta-mannosidase
MRVPFIAAEFGTGFDESSAPQGISSGRLIRNPTENPTLAMKDTPQSVRSHFFRVAALTGAVLFSAAAYAGTDGVNLQPSYYNNGNVNFGWSLMNSNSKIKAVRIEIEPGKETQAKTWISQAASNGKYIIATYHKSAVLGSDSASELATAGTWWKTNYSSFHSVGTFQINLMNEWGSHTITSNAYASDYNTAISSVRSVYSGNIIIDIPGWGQESKTAYDAVKGTNGTKINDTNITLSCHLYPGDWNQGNNHTFQTSDLYQMANSGRTCIVGEFGSGSGSSDAFGMTDTARNAGWSVMGWAWNGDGNSLNMVSPSWASNATATSFTESSYFSTIYNHL